MAKKSPAAQIVEFMNRIYYHGMTTTSGGNLSVIEPDGTVWISPSGVDKGSLTTADIMSVTKAGKITGKHKPSVEYPFHRAIYDMCPDVKAIIHAHPPTLVSYSVAAQSPDTKLYPELAELCGSNSYAKYAVPGSKLLGKYIAAEFAKGQRVIMMENHGVVLGTDTMLHAFQKFESLDFAGRIGYRAKLIGKAKTLNDTAIAKALKVTLKNGDFKSDKNATSDTRKLMQKYAARCYEQKLFTSGTGMLAVRLTNDRFLITPASFDRQNLGLGEIVEVRGNLVEKGKKVSRDAAFAAKIFANDAKINAICLAQSPNIMAYAVTNVEFDPRVIPESYLVLREVPRFAFGKRDDAAKKLSVRYPVVIVSNDAVITTGGKLHEAFDRLEVLEYSANATIMATKFGGLNPMNDAQVAEIIHDFNLQP